MLILFFEFLFFDTDPIDNNNNILFYEYLRIKKSIRVQSRTDWYLFDQTTMVAVIRKR